MLQVSLIYATLFVIVLSCGTVSYAQEVVNMKSEFERRGNQFIAFYEYFQMIRFELNTTDSSICPVNECTFSFYDGQMHPDITGEYAVNGKLRIEGNGEERISKTHDVRIDLDVSKMLGEENATISSVTGRMGIGGNTLFNSLYKFEIVNGTLSFEGDKALLDIYGLRT